MVPPPCSSSTNWERREATRGHRLHGVGHHLRPRPRAARGRGMGWDLLLPGRAGCHAARRLAGPSPGPGRSRPGPPGRGVSRQAAPRGARGPVRRGAGGQQPRHAPLLPARAPLRADVGRRPAVDLARARSPGDGPGRAVHQLHFGLRDGPGDGAAVAPRLLALSLCRSAQPVPRKGAGRPPRPAAPPRCSRLVRLLRHRPAELRRDGATRPRSARRRGGRPGPGVPHAGRDTRPAGRGVLHGRPRPHRLDPRGRNARARRRPDGVRRRARGHGGGLAHRRCGPRGRAAARHAHGRAQRQPPRRQRPARPPVGPALGGVTRLVEVPAQFDDRSFDQFAGAFAEAAKDGERLLFDAHATEWASPYGLVGLLAAGQAVRGPGGGSGGTGERPLLTAPTHAEVLTYWTRAGFFREAAELFEIHGKVPRVKAAEESDVLLPVTPVRAAEDVHAVVSNIQQRASAILASELRLDPKATMGFAMALSEACQNIVEHAGTGGWVAVQSYHWRRTLARRVVVIAVADAGVGFRHSLEPTQAKRFGERWGDAAPLEAALVPGRTMAAAEPAFAIARMDFTGVGCIDYSCADEIVAKLLRARPAVLVLTGISDGHREAIEPVLAGHGLAALLERPDGTLDALGAPQAAAALVEELVARRLAARSAGGTIALTLS